MVNADEIWRQIDTEPTSMVYSAWKIEKQKLIELLFNPGGYAIEIGSFAGGTSRALGVACKFLHKKLVCIDPWEGKIGQEQHLRYLQSVSDIEDSVITVKASSCSALHLLPKDLPGNVCLLFIDGNHVYPQPLRDMWHYWPLIAEGGAMAIHDIFDVWWHAGILQSVTEFFMDKPGYCLEAMNYIPTLEEANDAKHHSSGLMWVSKGKKLPGYRQDVLLSCSSAPL